MILCPLHGKPVVTQPFGGNRVRYAQYGLNGHPGTDLRCASGTLLFAPCEGYLHYGDDGVKGYGKFVEITSEPYLQDGPRRQVILGHLSRFMAGLEGTFVYAGDQVGLSGSTGDSTAPHCHLGYRKLDRDKNILDDANGYHGFIDIAPYVLCWDEGNTLNS